MWVSQSRAAIINGNKRKASKNIFCLNNQPKLRSSYKQAQQKNIIKSRTPKPEKVVSDISKEIINEDKNENVLSLFSNSINFIGDCKDSDKIINTSTSISAKEVPDEFLQDHENRKNIETVIKKPYVMPRAKSKSNLTVINAKPKVTEYTEPPCKKVEQKMSMPIKNPMSFSQAQIKIVENRPIYDEVMCTKCNKMIQINHIGIF